MRWKFFPGPERRITAVLSLCAAVILSFFALRAAADTIFMYNYTKTLSYQYAKGNGLVPENMPPFAEFALVHPVFLNFLQTFVLIAVPLSVPVLSTVGLFVGLAYWNSWTNALYYVTDPKLFGIQNLLMRIMRNIEYIRSGTSDMSAEGQLVTLPGNSIRMALALIGILPIILIYPFVQKYFVRGVIVGAVKG